MGARRLQYAKTVYFNEFDVEKFAELIVKECAGIYSKIDNGNLHMGTDDYLEALHKTFFGVEEQVTEPSELHTCPYAEEIHGDYETLCDCDEEKQHQCRMDI